MITRILFCLLFLAIATLCPAQQEYYAKNGKYVLVKDSIRVEGAVVRHYAAGRWVTKQMGPVVNGKQTWRLIEINTYKYGLLHGLHVTFTPEGDTVEVGKYKEGRPIEQWRVYDRKKLSSVSNYDDAGNRKGWQLGYFRDGTLRRKEFFSADNHFYEWTYSEGGYPLTRGATIDGKRSGTWYLYDTVRQFTSAADTLPERVISYLNGIPDGVDQQYYAGQLVSSVNWNKGMRDGAYRYYRNNTVIREGSYSDGQFHGMQSVYSSTGVLIARYNYSNGQPNGEYVLYDSITKVAVDKRSYDHGTLLSMKKYTPDSVLIAEQLVIDRTAKLYMYTEFYPNGKEKAAGRKVKNARTGSYESWHENGKRMMTATFREDQYSGIVEIWNAKGIKVLRAHAHKSCDTIPEEIWSDAGTKLAVNSKAYKDQRAKYIPKDLLPHYEELLGMGYVSTFVAPPLAFVSLRHQQVHSGINSHDDLPSPETQPLSIREFFQKHILYPEADWQERKDGQTSLAFTVRPDGKIGSVVVKRSASPALDSTAVATLLLIPKWKPVYWNGVAQESGCWLDFNWEVQGKKEKED